MKNLALTALLAVSGVSMIGCASDSTSNPKAPTSTDRGSNGNGAFGETPDRPGSYAAPNTGTTDSDRGPAASGNGAAK